MSNELDSGDQLAEIHTDNSDLLSLSIYID